MNHEIGHEIIRADFQSENSMLTFTAFLNFNQFWYTQPTYLFIQHRKWKKIILI